MFFEIGTAPFCFAHDGAVFFRGHQDSKPLSDTKNLAKLSALLPLWPHRAAFQKGGCIYCQEAITVSFPKVLSPIFTLRFVPKGKKTSTRLPNRIKPIS